MGSSASAFWDSPKGERILREQQKREEEVRYKKLKEDSEFVKNYEKEQYDKQ